MPHGKLIAKVMRTRVHHATRSFFWETCGDGHDAGPGRLETSWNDLKIGVHARTSRRSRLVLSECKKKNLLQVHLLNRSDTVTVYLFASSPTGLEPAQALPSGYLVVWF